MSTENNIEDLKSSKKYKLGDVVEVLGFHAKGDGSHHKRIAKDNDDGSGELGQNGIWWCIVHSGEVNVSWFGAKGDEVTDDTEAIQKAIDVSNVVFLKKGTYMINAIKKGSLSTKDLRGLETRDDSIINFSKGATLKCIPNSSDRYCVLWVSSQNVVINNATIIGDRDKHITTSSSNPNNVDGYTGEWGYGIKVTGAKNVTIKNPHITKCWGDSYIIDTSENVEITNLYASHSRRQGLSIISGKNLKIINPLIENIGGTKPQAGIDIEPDNALQTMENIFISNLVAKKCAGNALELAFIKQTESSPLYDVVVDSVVSQETNGVSVLFASDNCATNVKFGKIEAEQLYINTNNKKAVVDIDTAILKTPLRLSIESTTVKSLDYTTNIHINKLIYTEEVSFFIQDYTASTTTLNLKEPKIFISSITSPNTPPKTSSYRNLFMSIFNCVAKSGSDTASANVSLSASALNANHLEFNKTVDLNLTISRNSIVAGTETVIKNVSDKKITLIPSGEVTINQTKSNLEILGKSLFKVRSRDGVNFEVDIDYQTIPVEQTLDTPYYTLKMQQEGIYEDYVAYRDELFEYKNSQATEDTMLLPVLQEPEIPDSVKAFAKKYKLI